MENSIPYNLSIKKRNIFSLEENHNLNFNSLKNNDTYQVKLRHKYVHGYHSKKNNILKFVENKFMYPIKNLIVIYDLINRDQLIFSHHTNQVFLIRCKEEIRTVLSAEEEKKKIKIFIWNKLNLEILSEIKIKKKNFIDIDYLNDKNIILLCKDNDKLILCRISLVYKNKEIRLNKKCVSIIKSLNDFYIHVKTEKRREKDQNDEYFEKCNIGLSIEKNDPSREKGSIYCIKNIKNINNRYVKQNKIYSTLNQMMKKKIKRRRKEKLLKNVTTLKSMTLLKNVTSLKNITLGNNNFSCCKKNEERFLLIDTLKKKKLFKKSILKKIKNQKCLINMIRIKSKKYHHFNFSSYYIKFRKPFLNKNKYYNKCAYKNIKIVVDINENILIYNEHYIFVYIIKDYNIYERLKYKNFKCPFFSSGHMFYLRKDNFYFFSTFYFELFINSLMYNRGGCLKKYKDIWTIKKNEQHEIGKNYFINDEEDHMRKTKLLTDSNEYNKDYFNIFNSTFEYENDIDVEYINMSSHNNNKKYDNNNYDSYYNSEHSYQCHPFFNIQINVVEIFNFVCIEQSDDINIIFKIKDEYGKKRRDNINRTYIKQKKKKKKLIIKKYLVIGTKNGMIIINDFLKPHKIIHLEKICNEPIVSIFIFENDMLILNRSGIIFFMNVHNFVIYKHSDIFFSMEDKTKNISYEKCNNNIEKNIMFSSEETTKSNNDKKKKKKKMNDKKKFGDHNNIRCNTFNGERCVYHKFNMHYCYKEPYIAVKMRDINSFCQLNMYTILIGTTYNEIIIYNLLCKQLCYIYQKNNKKISSYNIHNNNIIYSIENCLYKMNLQNYDTKKLLCLPEIYISSFVFYSDDVLICGSFKGNLYFIDICNNNNIKIINRIRKEDFVEKQGMRIHKKKEVLFVFKKKIVNNKYIINNDKCNNNVKIYNDHNMKKNNKIISIHLNKQKTILICSFSYCIYIYKLNISGNQKIDLRCISYFSINNIIHIHVIKNIDNLFYITTRDDENICSYNYYLCSMNPCKIKTNKMIPLYFNILFENTWFYEFYYYNHKDDSHFLFVQNNWHDEKGNKCLILLDDSIFIIYTYCINKSRQNIEDINYREHNFINVVNNSHVIRTNESMGSAQEIIKNDENNKIYINNRINKNNKIYINNRINKNNKIYINNRINKNNKIYINNRINKNNKIYINNRINKNNKNNVNTSCDDNPESTNQVKNTFPFNKIKKKNIFHTKSNEHVDNIKKDVSLLSLIKNKEEKKINNIDTLLQSCNILSKRVPIRVMLKNEFLNVRCKKENLKNKNEEKEDGSKEEFLKKMNIIIKKKNYKINNHYITYKLLKSMLKRKKNIYFCKSQKLNYKHHDHIIKKDNSFIRRGINNESYIRDANYLGVNKKNEIQKKNFRPNIEVNKEIIEIEKNCNSSDYYLINNDEINNFSYCINKETKLRTNRLGYIETYLKKYMNTDIKKKGEFMDKLNISSNNIKNINSNLYKISAQKSDTINYIRQKDKIINSSNESNYLYNNMIRLPQKETVTYIEKKKKDKIDVTEYDGYTKLIKKKKKKYMANYSHLL
ncbi:conserved Plasmodium protein, unknown function [Plasmodium sp. gorilla clade G2]|uniref:conserved Plasmodium protein, unknown function n=1 Tax=Plasmodium sp. gorilla clade G2 TaxID=880535 RepID=UPI000D223997|nr:conserved Plasmodium protein, unknown function [Plasmodium sp. gorilla clade G2]SOV10617.1 conserved Plasmodium protein, unknown function [Plasmodium sp. gorilla clade G2]